MDTGLPDGFTRTEIAPGITAIDVSTPTCRGRIVDQGAHVTDWTPHGQDPVIFTSSRARYEPGRAIRGGIPVCLPWFGPGLTGDRSPAHGYARTSMWRLTSAEVQADVARVVLGLDSRDVPGAAEDFTAELAVSFGAELTLNLTVTARADLEFSEALHTYLAVGDVRGIEILGLEDAEYLDKLTGATTSAPGPLRLDGPADRVYTSQADVTVRELGGRTLRVTKSGSAHTVVWNPWASGALDLSDLDDAEWTGFVCVEAATVAPPITLEADQQHTLSTTISSTPMSGSTEA